MNGEKELYHGRPFLETYECEAKVVNNVLSNVACKDQRSKLQVFNTLTFVKKEAIGVSEHASSQTGKQLKNK